MNHKTQILKLIKDCSLEKGDIFIDLGSHLGEELEELVKVGVRVHSFEPHPKLSEILRQRYGDNPLVVLNEAAATAGGSDGFETLYYKDHIDDIEDGGSTLSHDKFLVSQGIVPDYVKTSDFLIPASSNPNKSSRVKAIDIVGYIKKIKEKIKVLKIDVEGTEYELLESLLSSGVLKDIDYIYCEDHEDHAFSKNWHEQKRKVSTMLSEKGVEIKRWF